MNRTKTNNKARREIAKQVKELNLDFCEIRLPGCNGLFLASVHRHKRRWYYDKPDCLLWDRSEWKL